MGARFLLVGIVSMLLMEDGALGAVEGVLYSYSLSRNDIDRVPIG